MRPIKESSHSLLEGGGEGPSKTPPSTTIYHHSHQPSPHNSHPNSTRKMEWNQSWLAQDVVSIPRYVHDLPKYPRKFLPKYDQEQNESP